MHACVLKILVLLKPFILKKKKKPLLQRERLSGHHTKRRQQYSNLHQQAELSRRTINVHYRNSEVFLPGLSHNESENTPGLDLTPNILMWHRGRKPYF